MNGTGRQSLVVPVLFCLLTVAMVVSPTAQAATFTVISTSPGDGLCVSTPSGKCTCGPRFMRGTTSWGPTRSS